MLAGLAAIIFLGRWLKRARDARNDRRFMAAVLADAQRENAVFDIRLKTGAQTGISARLEAVSGRRLQLKGSEPVGQEWNGKPVEAFFHVNQPEGPVFFVFDSRISSLGQGGAVATLDFPARLRVEKKRHFHRVIPDPAQLRMLAVWPVHPGRRLPRANADLGKPAFSWKHGQTDKALQLENISGGGLAFKIALPENGVLNLRADRGDQLFCLIVYQPEGETGKILFWCSGEIMSVRKAGAFLSIGLEFTNWAVQQPGSTEIHWTHSSPWQGAKPVLKWIDQLQKQKAGGNLGSGT